MVAMDYADATDADDDPADDDGVTAHRARASEMLDQIARLTKQALAVSRAR
jgi:hypothetical protein